MDNVNREMEILRQNKTGKLEIKNTVKEMENAFDGDISRLDMTEERVSELENMSIKTSQTEKQRGETEKKWRKISSTVGQLLEGKEREKGTEEISESIMTEDFSKLISETKAQIQETQRTPRRINARHYT